jgi:3-hydroxypropionate dehydrogenase (NADP+)
MVIKKVACIGLGLVGQGWATIFSSKGYEVTLYDISDATVEDSFRAIESNLTFLETCNFLDQGDAQVSLKRIRATRSIRHAVRDADYVQESVLDDYDIKKEVFREIDAVAPAKAILASSSSGLLMTEIQKVTARPERCVLIHPLLPVHLIPIVEVVGGKQTSSQTVNAAVKFIEKLGKIPIVLNKEVPGYIVNRLQAALVREAIDLVDKGVATPENVDRAFSLGMGLRDPLIGPFMRMYLAGQGIDNFFRNYSKSYEYRWETMETWTSIPFSAVEKVVEGVRNMKMVQNKSLEEIKYWRDHMLVHILKLIFN